MAATLCGMIQDKRLLLLLLLLFIIYRIRVCIILLNTKIAHTYVSKRQNNTSLFLLIENHFGDLTVDGGTNNRAELIELNLFETSLASAI